MKTAIIGAGMAGLTCGRLLQQAGQDVVIFDKGRGLGGRMATRRAEDGLQFDHGAQYVTARDKGFASLLTQARADGHAGLWPQGGARDGKARYVGTPGMSGLARFLARDLVVHRQSTVSALAESAAGVEIDVAGERLIFDRVVCTAPAPQTLAMLGEGHALSHDLAQITYDPCLTLMVALAGPVPDVADHQRNRQADLSWIARDGSKPERPGNGCWVAQASPDFSRTHLDSPVTATARRMTGLFVRRMGLDPDQITYSAAHRWRYARVATPLGKPFIGNSAGTLFIGGDGFLGPRVEAAYLSGKAIAEELLGR